LSLSFVFIFFFSSRRRHTRLVSDWSSDVCSSDLLALKEEGVLDDAALEALDQEVRAAVEEAVKFADSSPDPDPSELDTHVLADRSEERRVGKECRTRWLPYR